MENLQPRELNVANKEKEDLNKNINIASIFYLISLIQDSNDIPNYEKLIEQHEKINSEGEEAILNGYENMEKKSGANIDAKGIIGNNVNTESTEKKDNNSQNLKKILAKQKKKVLRRNLKFRRIIKKRKIWGKHKLTQKKNSNKASKFKKNNKKDFIFRHPGENIGFIKEEVAPDEFKILKEGKPLSENIFEDVKGNEKVVKTPIIDNQNNDNYDAMSLSSLGEKDNDFQNKDNKENSAKDSKADNKPISSGKNKNGNQHNSSNHDVTEINEDNNPHDDQSEKILLYEGNAEKNDVQDPIPHGEMTYYHTYEEDMPEMNYFPNAHVPDFLDDFNNFANNENANQNDNGEDINFFAIQNIESNQ